MSGHGFTLDELRTSADLVEAIAAEAIPRELKHESVSEWAERRRVLPRGLTPYPGPYSFDSFPFLREIVDNFAEGSPIEEAAVMKGTQLGFTVGVLENWLGYVIDVSPGPTAFVTADADMAAQQMARRIDALISSADLGSKIYAQHKRASQRKTGDTKARKEFPGGHIDALGPKSGTKLRAESYRFLALDEVDTYPQALGSEGDSLLHIRRRTDAFAETRKILTGSTPLLKHNSLIEGQYRLGDQRKFFVPCPKCRRFDFLRWSQLRFDKDESGSLVCRRDSFGRVVESSVRYECPACGHGWRNADKDAIFRLGEWRPTAQARRPRMRSYHLPGLYSPVGFRSFEDAVTEWLEIEREGFPRLKLQNFVNTYLAETFAEEGSKPKIETIVTRERTYVSGALPPEARPCFLTLAADVQIDRIEAEIVAWGRDCESWSIAYHVLPGDTESADSESWRALAVLIESKHAGRPLALAGIDSGYRTATVYGFAAQFESGVFPVMGADDLSRGSRFFELREIPGSPVPRIDFNTDLLKQQVYEYLNKSKYEDGRRPIGYCNFPADYPRKYFDGLTAETRLLSETKTGSKFIWDRGSRRNEPLDCRVYGLGLVHCYREIFRQAEGLDDLPWPGFWDLAERDAEERAREETNGHGTR